MAFVKHIRAISEMHDDPDDYVLVLYGSERKMFRHTRGVSIIITAPPGMSDHLKRLDFLATVEDARRIADEMDIPTVYILLNDEPAPPPTH